jgi:hypothetical protein
MLAAGAVVGVTLVTATPAAAAGSISVIADFEGGAPDGFFAYGAAGYGIVDVAAGSPEAKPGQTDPTKVVSYGWDVTAPGSFGGIGQSFAAARDVSAFDGVTLMVDGSGNGAVYQVELFDGGANADASERFDVDVVDDTDGWKELRLPWSAFTRATAFQPGGAPDDGLGLTTLWGYAIPAVNGADTIRVDDIAVYSDSDLTPSVSFSAAAASAIEGDAVDVEVRLDLASTSPVTVDLSAIDGTATLADGDYADPATTVEFAPGETSRIVQVATGDDDVEELDETFTLALANAGGAQLGSIDSFEVTILDDDGEVVGPPDGRTLIVDDHEAPLVQGDAGGIPVGWFAAQDPSSSVAFERTDAPPAPVPGAPEGNDVLAADFDVTSFGVVVRNFTNETADAWTTQTTDLLA